MRARKKKDIDTLIATVGVPDATASWTVFSVPGPPSSTRRHTGTDTASGSRDRLMIKKKIRKRQTNSYTL